MADLLDNCRFLAGSMGTADFADGAADPTFRNLEDAGAEDGKTYPYKAQNATGTEWEIGRGMALNTSGGWILERTSIQDSSNGGSLVNFGTAPKVIITAGREEFGAETITYDPTDSGLSATDVQGAVDELAALTGGGGDPEALDALFLDQRMTTLIVAEALERAIFSGPDGSAIHDHFDELTYVDDENATDLDTSEPGCLKPGIVPGSAISQAAGSNIGDFTAGGGLAAAFNGVWETTGGGGAAQKTTTTSGYIGKDYGGSPRPIGSVIAKAPSESSFGNAGTDITLELYGRASGTPSTETDGTLLATMTFPRPAPGDPLPDKVKTLISSDQTTSFQCWWVRVVADASGALAIAELEPYEPDVPENVTVASTPITAAEQPDEMRAVALLEDEDGVTLDDDTFLDFSRDDGVTWAQATLSEMYTQPGHVRVLDTGNVDVSGQPAGAELRWRWRTDNGVIVKLLGIAMWGRGAAS